MVNSGAKGTNDDVNIKDVSYIIEGYVYLYIQMRVLYQAACISIKTHLTMCGY